MRAASYFVAVAVAVLLSTNCGGGSGGSNDSSAQPKVTFVGTPTGASTTATIGSAGGTLTDGSGAITLRVPAGALTSEVVLSVEPITSEAPGSAGTAFRFGPEGTVFAVPATIAYTVDAGLLDTQSTLSTSGSLGGLGLAYQDSAGLWDWVASPAADATAQTVSVSTSHLSDWSLVKGEQLSPLSASVKTGGSVVLEVVGCYGDHGSAKVMLGYDCSGQLAVLYPVTQWAVNGIPGGDATVGTLVQNGQTATYQAPATKPSPATVTVTASLSSGFNGVSDVVVFSEIAITEPSGHLQGTIDFDFTYALAGTQSFHAKATVDMPSTDQGSDETDYSLDSSGAVTLSPTSFDPGGVTCEVEEATMNLGRGVGIFKVLHTNPPTVRFGFTQTWNFDCPGMPNPLPVSLYFYTFAGGASCSTPVSVPITNESSPSGSYSMACDFNGTTSAAATWSLAEP